MTRLATLLTGAVCLLVLSSLDRAAAADAPTENLLPNASFEKVVEQKPDGWKTITFGGKGKFTFAAEGRTGKRCVVLASDEGADIGWQADVPVDMYSTYRLSGWIKTENVQVKGSARGALLNLHNIQPTATKAVRGTSDWTRVELTFETAENDAVQVNCLLGGWGLATGTAYYDDLRLEQLSKGSWTPSIQIDADKTGEPVSKYIYGQFIEHLGRCIYGGIWAEMLEDRKFWYPITAQYDPYKGRKGPFPVVGASPWQILGKDDSVAMVKEDSFVGDHTPQIARGGGIAQHDLALRKGKEYTGYVWLKPAKGKTTVRVSLCWGEKPEQRQTDTIAIVGEGYTKSPLHFRAVTDTEQATLRIECIDRGPCLVGTVSLMPADNIQGMRADTLALLKELDSPVYRWPGGNFVSGYDWKDGIGPRDRRPPRTNPAWTGVEHNDFGLDEFMLFCKLLKTEPYIAVNSGLGGVDNAVAELQYTNGGPDTPMGKVRAKNGHPEPYDVKWWGIGNEMYGGWQLGHMSLEDYVKKHNVFAKAMQAEDPSTKLVAVGSVGQWSEGMMQHCAEHMDLISEHFYRQGNPSVAAHVFQIPDAVRAKAVAHRRYREQFDSLDGKDIRIALDEWNYWYGPHVFGELGTRYFLKDGLGVAAGINEYVRQSDIMFMANYAQTVNVIGCIKTSKTDASFATTGLALKLYRQHFGVTPVAVEAPRPLDVAAAWNEDRTKLTIALVNPTRGTLDIPLAIKGAKLTGSGTSWQIAGDDPMAYNEPGKRPKVEIVQRKVAGITDRLTAVPYSVTLFVLDVK